MFNLCGGCKSDNTTAVPTKIEKTDNSVSNNAEITLKSQENLKEETSAMPATSQLGLRCFTLCGPSGSGKSTLLKRLFAEFPGKFGFSVSHTTRSPRPGEIDGKDYHFIERAQMEKKVAAGDFLENAEFAGNMYGTSFQAVNDVLSSGCNVVLDIDMQGVIQLQAAVKEGRANLNGTPYYIFIAPPSIEDLEKRLNGRGTETPDSLAKRLGAADKEIAWAKQAGSVNVYIVNDDENEAFQRLKETIQSSASV